jgi:hypothetical protein
MSILYFEMQGLKEKQKKSEKLGPLCRVYAHGKEATWLSPVHCGGVGGHLCKLFAVRPAGRRTAKPMGRRTAKVPHGSSTTHGSAGTHGKARKRTAKIGRMAKIRDARQRKQARQRFLTHGKERGARQSRCRVDCTKRTAKISLPGSTLPCVRCRASTHGKDVAVRFGPFAVRSPRTAKHCSPVVIDLTKRSRPYTSFDAEAGAPLF